MIALGSACVEPGDESLDPSTEGTTEQTLGVSNATLACYVDTTAFDRLTSGYCVSVWMPGQPNPTSAHFEVVGLTSGSYTFTWSSSGCSSTSYWCNRTIRKDTSGGQPVTTSVTIRDNATGATKTVSATAEYIDGWN